jgi:ribonuclease HI
MSESATRPTLHRPLVAFCDGSYNPVTRFGGWCYQLLVDGRKVMRSGACEGEAPTDFEVLAAVRVLEGTSSEKPLVIKSDCMALVSTAQRLCAGGSLRVKKMRAALKALYLRLAELLKDRLVTFQWVRGHSGVLGNVDVDRGAKSSMRHASQAWEKRLEFRYHERTNETGPWCRNAVLGG